MPLVHLNDTNLFYTEVGTGLPCLIMHGGLGFDHTYLHPWLDALGDTLHLIYYDHRGNGRSDRPPLETLTFEQFCADADALRTFLGFNRIALLGHSYGGFIALEYALRYPNHMSHLILVDTAPAMNYGEEIDANIERKVVTDEIREVLNALPSESEAESVRRSLVMAPLYFFKFDAERARRLYANRIPSREANRRGNELLQAYNLIERLPEIRTPTLVLVGRDDFICPPSQAQIIRDGIPNSELVIFEESGHFPFVEEEEAFFKVVRRWLEGKRELPADTESI